MPTNLTPEDVEARLIEKLREAKVSLLPVFFAYAHVRSLLSITRSTANSYEQATKSFLDALGDHLGDADIRELPVDRWCQEYARVRGGALSEQTLLTYQSRFRRAVDLYRMWLGESDPTSPTQDRSIDSFLSRPAAEFRPVDEVISVALQRTDRYGLVPYVCTLRDGRVTYLLLPHPLSRADAEQLSTYVLGLAVDPEPNSSSSEPRRRKLPEHLDRRVDNEEEG